MEIRKVKTQQMLTSLHDRLHEGERARAKELRELQELSRAIMRIQESDEKRPPVRDLMLANSVLPCKAETAQEALKLLKEGNAAFLKYGAKALLNKDKKSAHPLELHLGQRPHAVLVTCSDSRVPPELVFGQGLGDLFVVRIAGNAVDTLARASIMYAIQHLYAPLVVVMGHESCGAVQASLLADEHLVDEPSDIKSLVHKIRGGLKSVTPMSTDEERVMCGVVCNVHHTVQALRSHPDIANLAASKGVQIVGAYYAFNGSVTFFDEYKKEGDSKPSKARGKAKPKPEVDAGVEETKVGSTKKEASKVVVRSESGVGEEKGPVNEEPVPCQVEEKEDKVTGCRPTLSVEVGDQQEETKERGEAKPEETKANGYSCLSDWYDLRQTCATTDKTSFSLSSLLPSFACGSLPTEFIWFCVLILAVFLYVESPYILDALHASHYI